MKLGEKKKEKSTGEGEKVGRCPPFSPPKKPLTRFRPPDTQDAPRSILLQVEDVYRAVGWSSPPFRNLLGGCNCPARNLKRVAVYFPSGLWPASDL